MPLLFSKAAVHPRHPNKKSIEIYHIHGLDTCRFRISMVKDIIEPKKAACELSLKGTEQACCLRNVSCNSKHGTNEGALTYPEHVP